MQCYFHPPPPCSTQSLLSGITFDFHQDCFNITTSNQQYPTQHPNWTHYWLQTSWTPSQLTQRTLPQTSSIPVSPTSRKTSHHFSTISLISKLGCICFRNASSKNYIAMMTKSGAAHVHRQRSLRPPARIPLWLMRTAYSGMSWASRSDDKKFLIMESMLGSEWVVPFSPGWVSVFRG